MESPKAGSCWRHRRTRRVACVRGVLRYGGTHLVEYRYVLPPDESRGNGQLRPRVNTTARRIDRFLQDFERLGDPTFARSA